MLYILFNFAFLPNLKKILSKNELGIYLAICTTYLHLCSTYFLTVLIQKRKIWNFCKYVTYCDLSTNKFPFKIGMTRETLENKIKSKHQIDGLNVTE